MEEIASFIREELLVLIPVLYVLGVLFKDTPHVADWLIPWLLLGVAVLLASIILDSLLQGVLQGVLVTGVTVLTHQLVKQSSERKSS